MIMITYTMVMTNGLATLSGTTIGWAIQTLHRITHEIYNALTLNFNKGEANIKDKKYIETVMIPDIIALSIFFSLRKFNVFTCRFLNF